MNLQNFTVKVTFVNYAWFSLVSFAFACSAVMVAQQEYGRLTRGGEASMAENTREPFMRKMLWHALRMHLGYVMDQWY